MRIDEQTSYYESVFAAHMAGFVRYKRTQGLKYADVPRTLRALSRFIASTGQTEMAISQELADQWCRRRPNERASNQRKRVAYTNQFLNYLASQDVPVAFPQSPKRRGNRDSFTPYVFTRRELDQLFAAFDRLEAKTPSVMPVVLPVLIRLLYGCGLRVSEALNLTRGDVHLNNCYLTVRHAKFDQDRLVPLSSSLASIMRRYDATAPRLFTADRDTRFFTHLDGRAVTSDNVYRWFRKTLWAAGISHGGRGHGPRVHDLRHTFAVYSLQRLANQGADVYWALPVLATYLGHASVGATGQYVRLIPDLFQILGSIAEFEHALMSERTRDGLAAARARGRTGGQKPKLGPRQIRLAREMYEEKGPDGKRAHTVEHIAQEFGVTRPTIYRHLAKP